MKKFLSIILALFTVFTVASCAPQGEADVTPTITPTVADTPTQAATPTPADSTEGLTQQEINIGLKKYIPTKSFVTRPGLYVENGLIMHEGKPFYNIGVNFYSLFTDLFLDTMKGLNESERVFKLMNEHGIKYCRVNFGMFWPNDYKHKENNLNDYYAFMDLAVKMAEKYDIGLICCMFWNFQGLSDFMGESTNAWGDPNSKTRQYMREYTELIVNRYKESPAIWGWEFANELSLALDLPNRAEIIYGPTSEAEQSVGAKPFRDENDYLFTDDVMNAVVEWAELVDECDPYDRIIETGNSEPREGQYNQYHYDSWRKDTYDQMKEIMGVHNPDPVDTISVHIYEVLQRYSGMETYSGIVGNFKKAANELGKPLFIGEFAGIIRGNPYEIIDAIVEHKIQLSALWSIGNVEYSIDNEPENREKILDYIKQANEALAS